MIDLKRRWDENRGDKYSGWGGSWWFFETDQEGNVLRQIEAYDNGPKKKYCIEKPSDNDGMLAKHRLDLKEFETDEISQDEFEKQWA